MDVNELYRRLALGELSNLALADAGAIDNPKKPTIVLHANEGLLKLYGRFLLKEDSLFIDQDNGRTIYPLQSKYALSNTDPDNDAPRFINDTLKPFTDDVVRITGVYTQAGDKLPLNDVSQVNSVFSPQPAVLQVPYPVEGAPLAVLYQASHPILSEERPEQQIELPEFLMGALTSYIASRVFTHMNTQENTAKAAEHLNTYESICVDAINQDLVTAGSTSGVLRFEKNGWI